MIKTIEAETREEFDERVNAFEKQTAYKTGVSRVFATQTHVIQNVGCKPRYIAVVFYKGYIND